MAALGALQRISGKSANHPWWHLKNFAITMRAANLLSGSLIFPRLKSLSRSFHSTLDNLQYFHNV